MKHLSSYTIRAVLSCGFALWCAAARANVIVVDNTSDSNDGEIVVDCSLREAMDVAAPGDIIFFASPLFDTPQTISISRTLVIDKGITIAGPGADKLTIKWVFPPQDDVFRVDHVNGTVTIDGLAIDGSGAAYAGILNQNSQLFVTHCYVHGNLLGGIVSEEGNLFVLNTTISGNSNTGGGGGIDCSSGATLTLENSTVTGNSSNANGDGAGGIYMASGCPAEITCCTIFFNGIYSAGPGGGGIKSAGTTPASALTLRNTIVAGNWTTALWPGIHSDVVATVLVDDGYNLIGVDDAGAFTAIADQTGTALTPLDPWLDPLDYYGGPTPTLRLHSGSPAIDQGHRFGLTTDQREFSRPYDFSSIPNAPGSQGCDIGAYEVHPTPAIVIGGVFYPNGEAIYRALVAMKSPDGQVHNTVTDENGHFEFPNLRPGKYTVRVSHGDLQFTPQNVKLEPGESAQLMFRAKR